MFSLISCQISDPTFFFSQKRVSPQEHPHLSLSIYYPEASETFSTLLGLSHEPEEPLGSHSRLVPTYEAMCFQENHLKGLFVIFTLSQNAFPCLCWF